MINRIYDRIKVPQPLDTDAFQRQFQYSTLFKDHKMVYEFLNDLRMNGENGMSVVLYLDRLSENEICPIDEYHIMSIELSIL